MVAAIYMAESLFEAPDRYPDLYTVFVIEWSTCLFIGFLAFFNWKQFTLPNEEPGIGPHRLAKGIKSD